MLNKLPIKLNLGCGGRPLIDYVNIDMDTINDMRDRYPNQVFNDSLTIDKFQWKGDRDYMLELIAIKK